MEPAAVDEDAQVTPPSTVNTSGGRRRWLLAVAALGCLLLVVAGVVAWRVFQVLPTGPDIGAMNTSHLSASDQALLSQARRLGEQASTIGGNNRLSRADAVRRSYSTALGPPTYAAPGPTAFVTDVRMSAMVS